jgi:hypothetical protein
MVKPALPVISKAGDGVGVVTCACNAVARKQQAIRADVAVRTAGLEAVTIEAIISRVLLVLVLYF